MLLRCVKTVFEHGEIDRMRLELSDYASINRMLAVNRH